MIKNWYFNGALILNRFHDKVFIATFTHMNISFSTVIIYSNNTYNGFHFCSLGPLLNVNVIPDDFFSYLLLTPFNFLCYSFLQNNVLYSNNNNIVLQFENGMHPSLYDFYLEQKWRFVISWLRTCNIYSYMYGNLFASEGTYRSFINNFIQLKMNPKKQYIYIYNNFKRIKGRIFPKNISIADQNTL